MPSYAWRGSVGWAEETTYGTATTPNRWAPYRRESLRRRIPWGLSRAITGRGRPHRLHHRRPGRHTTEGDVIFPLLLEDQTLLWKAALGQVQTSQLSTSGVYTHKFTLDESLPSLSMEIGRDARVFVYKGLRVQRLRLVVDNSRPFVDLTVTLLGDGTQSNADSGETPSYSTSQRIWTPRDVSSCKIAGQEHSGNVWRFVLEIEHDYNDGPGGYGFRAERERLERVGRTSITGELHMSFNDQTQVDAIANETNRKLEVTMLGEQLVPDPITADFAFLRPTFPAEIETSVESRFENREAFSLLAEVARFDEGEPETEGVGSEIVARFDWRALDDGSTEPLTVWAQNEQSTV